jgi:hypothetical protein
MDPLQEKKVIHKIKESLEIFSEIGICQPGLLEKILIWQMSAELATSLLYAKLRIRDRLSQNTQS